MGPETRRGTEGGLGPPLGKPSLCMCYRALSFSDPVNELKVGCSLLENQYSSGKCWLLYSGGQPPGEKVDSHPRTKSWRFLKEKKGKRSQLIIEVGDLSPLHPPWRAGLCAGLSIPCDLSPDATLFTRLLMRLLKGKLGERRSPLWITYSSILLFFY